MAQEQTQEQSQQQSLKQTATISQQQLIQASLIELPLMQLVDRINTEMYDNPALESSSSNSDSDDNDSFDGGSSDDNFEESNEQESQQSALDEALSNIIGRDDEELPVYQGGYSNSEEREDIVYGNTVSFYDKLKEQMGLVTISEQEQKIMEYLIGSLDDDGLLRKSLDAVSDELAIYNNIDVSTKEIEKVLMIMQDFDPPGIAARSLQECLLLQIERREDSNVKTLMRKVVAKYFDEFTKNHWNKIKNSLNLTELQAKALLAELRKLNPKPGSSMSESIGTSNQQITPDFIVETLDDGRVVFHLNNDNIPELTISQSFADILNEYQNNKANMSSERKEVLLYTKNKIAAAQSFIEAIKVRRRTLTTTMQAIINWQYRFFTDGDESMLRPMILKDIADKTGLDISTISRVSNSKYAQTRWGMFPLRFFFNDAYITEDGEELSTRQIKAALRDIVEEEDKKHPLSDEALKEELNKIGYPIARRTVAKYREQLNIPIARLRRQ